MRPLLLAVVLLASGCLSPAPESPARPHADPAPAAAGLRPHVVIGIPDTGINPYHHAFYRPELTEPPCTYLQGFPCDLVPLNLTLGGADWQASFDADQPVWKNVTAGTWYWIPRTVFVAAYCPWPYGDPKSLCILDDVRPHGTETISSALSENPDALVVFVETDGRIDHMLDKKLPIDLFSISWATIVPIPQGRIGPFGFTQAAMPLVFKAAGNDPRPTSADASLNTPGIVVVGGAFAADGSESLTSGKQPDVVSYYCRPTAAPKTTTGMRENVCGTSFATPTVAGAVSKVILDVRKSTGYTGGLTGDVLDPIAGLTASGLHGALNATATYSPKPRFPNTGHSVPLNPSKPWLQWGWGFYDADVANATLDHLHKKAPNSKPQEAKDYMETVQRLRQVFR